MKIKKQDVNLTVQKALREVKRHFDVVMDDVKDEIKIIAEQHGDIKKTLDSHTEILNSHTKILDSHTEILDSHTKILDSHTEMIGSLAENITIIKTDIEFIKGALKKKVDYDEFAALERRLSLLEAKVRR